jgi:hypothetical protein
MKWRWVMTGEKRDRCMFKHLGLAAEPRLYDAPLDRKQRQAAAFRWLELQTAASGAVQTDGAHLFGSDH